MQEFGPNDTDHSRVPWPDKWQSDPPMMLPPWMIHNLSHNYPLSSEDHARMDDCRQSIARQISEKEEAIKRFQNDIERLKKEAFACEVITSPFRSLPEDILHHVSTVCPLIYPASAQYSNPKSHIPSILAQVSKAWRNATEGNCSAWQNMRFNCRIWNGEAIELPLERIERFGLLSGNLPISLHLDEKDPDEDDDDDDQVGFCRIVEWVLLEWEDRHRLTSLALFTPWPNTLSNLLTGRAEDENPAELPPVESFRLLTWEGDIDTGWLSGGEDLTRFLEAWPNLRRLWVGGHFGGNTFTGSNPNHNPWNKVKTLYIRAELKHGEWLACFRNCLELENAWLHIGGLAVQLFPSPVSFPSKTIVHQHLKELHLGLSDFGDPILRYFVGIQFPVLESLHLHFEFADPSTEPEHQAKDFISVFPALRHLAIHETGADMLSETIGGLFPLILAVPSTTSLWTSISHTHILEFLEFFRGKRFPLPNLQSYNLQFIAEPGTEWLSPREEKRLTNELILTRQKRPAVIPPLTSSSKKKTIHAGLAALNVLYRQFYNGEETMDDLESFGMASEMDDYFFSLREKFIKENVDIKVEQDWALDAGSLALHEGRAEREFMKRFDL